MKVLVLTNSAESLVKVRMQLLRACRAHGHEVFAAAPGYPTTVAKELAEAGIEYRSVQVERLAVNPLLELRALWSLFQLFRDIGPDAILAYTSKPIVYGAFAARYAGVPRCFGVLTGLPALFDGGGAWNRVLRSAVTRLYRMALPMNDIVFFQNRDDVETLNAIGALTKVRRTVVVNGSGVDLQQFVPVPLPHGPPVFLMISRLTLNKGVREFVSAASQVKRRYREARFILLGRTDVRQGAVPAAELARWTEDGCIELRAEVHDVRPIIAESSVCVLPSYREGVPRSILEAMAMGRPVITADAPGARDPVEQGSNGFVVPVRDPGALAKAMITFIEHPDLIATMGLRSRKLAEERYDVDMVNSAMISAMGLART